MEKPILAVALCLCVAAITACSDGAGDPIASADATADAGADSAPLPDVGTEPPPEVRPPWTLADPVGRVYAGNYLSPYQIAGFDTEHLTFAPAEPRNVGRPTGDVVGIAALGVVVSTMEGHDEIEVYDADTLAPIAGSPYPTGHLAVAVAHDDAISRLYVYCIGTVGDYERSLLTVYDTREIPFREVDASPYAIDVPANSIMVDPVTGRLVGLSIGQVWMAKVDDGGVTQLPASPLLVEGTPTGLALDPSRRRLYFGERAPGLEQRLRAFDLDEFGEVEGSPVVFAGRAVGSVVAHPETGTVFAIDFGEQKLHAFGAEPLAILDACGTMGCAIPPTETGLALDHARDRLFITHVPSLENPDDGSGFLTAWDVSDPASPTELTVPGERPRLGVFPNRLTVY